MTLPLDSFSRCCCRGCRSASDVTTFPSRLSYLSSHFIIPLHQALPSHHLLYAECPRMSLVPLRLDGLLFVSRLILLVWFVSWIVISRVLQRSILHQALPSYIPPPRASLVHPTSVLTPLPLSATHDYSVSSTHSLTISEMRRSWAISQIVV